MTQNKIFNIAVQNSENTSSASPSSDEIRELFQHLERAREVVKEWPTWKKEFLEQLLRPNNSKNNNYPRKLLKDCRYNDIVLYDDTVCIIVYSRISPSNRKAVSLSNANNSWTVGKTEVTVLGSLQFDNDEFLSQYVK